MADNFQADYVAKRGANPEEIKFQQEMQIAQTKDAKKYWMDQDIAAMGGEENIVAKGQAQGAEMMLAGAGEVAENAVQGAGRALRQTDTFLRENAVTGPAYSAYADTFNAVLDTVVPEVNEAVNNFALKLEADDTQNDVMAQKFFQYVTPFMGYTKGLQMAAGGSQAMTTGQQAAAVAGADIATSWSALEPHFDRMSQLLTEFETTHKVPVVGRVIEYLASTEGSDAENRLKNIGDSLLAGGVASTVVGALVGTLKIGKGLWQGINEGTLGMKVGPAAQVGAINPKTGKPAYENAPDSLMGFADDPSKQKGFDETQYKHTERVRVQLPDGQVFEDEIKGLNQAHALERAERNWDGATVTSVTRDGDTAQQPAPINADAPGQDWDDYNPELAEEIQSGAE